MKIGILQTGAVPDMLVSEHGEYPQMFRDFLAPFGFDCDAYAVLEGEFPKGPEAADGWLITGSRFGVYEDHAFIPPLMDFVRAAFAADRPLVGVCFGHQIIAKAMGGHVEKFDKGWAIGPTVYHFEDGDKTIHAYHQDQVITPPPGAKTLARNGFCAHAALYYPGKAYTVQAHPEFQDSYVQGLIEKRGKGVVPDAILHAASQELGTPLDRDYFARQFARFFRERSL